MHCGWLQSRELMHCGWLQSRELMHMLALSRSIKFIIVHQSNASNSCGLNVKCIKLMWPELDALDGVNSMIM